MVSIIARKEVQSLFRDGRFWIIAVVLLVLLGLGFVLSGQNLQQANAERGRAQQNSRSSWLNQPPKNPHRAAHFGNFAFRLKTPLSLFDNGLDNYTGTSVYLEPHKSDDFQFSPAADATGLSRFGELTPAFVLQSILPLLLIFLCFNAVSKEREDSTLRLLLTQGASFRQIVVGKSVGYWLAIWLILLPVFIGMAFVLPRQPYAPTGDVWLRYSLLVLDYALFTAIIIIGCVVVSAYSLTSRSAIMKLLGLWILTSIVMPKVAGNAGSLAYKTPSQYAYAGLIKQDEAAGLDGHDPHDKRRAVLLKAVLNQYHVDTVTALPVNFDAIAMVESEKYTTSIYQKRTDEVRDLFSRQNQFTTLSAFLNPIQAVQSTSMALCGTDYLQFSVFQDNAENYRLYFVNAMNDYMVSHTKNGDWTTTFGQHVYQAIRPFSYREPGVGWTIRHELTGFSAMLFWLMVSGLLIVTLKPNVL